MNATPEPARPDPFVPERRERQPRGWKKKYLWAEDEKRRLTDERDELLELNRFYEKDNGELRVLIAWHTSGRAFAELAAENSTLRARLEQAELERDVAKDSSGQRAIAFQNERDRRTASMAKHPTRWPS